LDLICDGLEPELVRVLKLSVFKKKYEKVHQITSKNDDFIFYFGSHFKQISYTDGEMIIKENDPPTKSKPNFNQVFFIESGNVLLYESKETKDSDVKIGNEESFGEIEYHQPQNKRVLLAKASGPVTCYTLSYEIYAKYCQNMIEKEVEELKETAIDRHTNIMNNLKKLHNERRMLERRNDKRISGDERRSDFRSDN
jgi:CRP-like cAMP-binding protein